MAEFGFELVDIERLIKLVESRGLERLRVEDDGRVIEILGPRTRIRPVEESDLIHSPATEAFEHEPEPPPDSEEEQDRIVIASPVVGVFYRSPSPDSPPFVEVGDRIEIGQPVGLIEAMKVFSEVVSDHAGIVAELAAKNGALVRQGEALLYLRTE